MSSWIRVLASLVLLATHVPGQAGGFVPGELYLHTPAATGISSTDGGMIHVDLVASTSDLLHDYDGTGTAMGSAAFDPYRMRVLFSATFDGANTPLKLCSTDAAGNVQELGFTGSAITSMAPTGDGRVYLHVSGDNTTPFRYLDAANQLQVLLDDTGTIPYAVPGHPGYPFDGMIHDPATNALFLASRSGLGICSGGNTQDVNIHKVPLSADGTQVSGPATCTQFDVHAGSGNEKPVSWSHLPSGDLLLAVDTNSNAVMPRLVQVDPVTLAATAFASPGPYTGAAASNAGIWSSVLGKAAVLDTFADTLRSFSSGETGSGTVISLTYPLSPAGSSGESVTLLEIPAFACQGAFIPYGAGLVGSGGFVPTLTADGCAVPGGSLTLEIAGGLGGAFGLMVVGPTPVDVPFAGGSLLVAPFVLRIPTPLGGASGAPGQGSFTLPGNIPNDPAYSGVSAFLQTLIVDPGAPQGIALTQGLQVEIG